LDPRITVTLVEPNAVFTACPFSNEVVAGLRELREQQFGYDSFPAAGILLAKQAAVGIDPQARNVVLADGSRLTYDRLVLAPGGDDRHHGFSDPQTRRRQYHPAAAGRPYRRACRRRRPHGLVPD